MSDLHGYYLEDLTVGMSASYAKTITDADVILFAGITGDDNPVHINEEYASQTMFKGRIVHGMFCAGLISCVAGTRLPGPGCIYIDQQMRFKAPVRVGDTVTATLTVKEINTERARVITDTICTIKGKVVVEGVATFMVDRKPA
ncbi:MAG: MaoC family dehydratase [Candidatus Competibacteraceae bacterium]